MLHVASDMQTCCRLMRYCRRLRCGTCTTALFGLWYIIVASWSFLLSLLCAMQRIRSFVLQLPPCLLLHYAHTTSDSPESKACIACDLSDPDPHGLNPSTDKIASGATRGSRGAKHRAPGIGIDGSDSGQVVWVNRFFCLRCGRPELRAALVLR